MKDLTDFNVSTSNNADDIVGDSKSQIANILSNASTKFTRGGLFGVGGTGFTGLSEKGLEELKTAINDFCKGVTGTVDEFRATANVSGAFKGDVSAAVTNFVNGTKTLIKAYVSNLLQESKEAEELFKSYREGTTNIRQNTGSGADEIRRNAQSVKFN